MGHLRSVNPPGCIKVNTYAGLSRFVLKTLSSLPPIDRAKDAAFAIAPLQSMRGFFCAFFEAMTDFRSFVIFFLFD